ncbi:marr-type hth domain [Desulfoluna spongiiphila]|nr:marr-type hth domain [Desulfoluna spongiiphila]
MKQKEAPIKNLIQKITQVLHKYERMEKLPLVITIDGGDPLTVSTKEVHTIEVIGNHQEINITDVAGHFGITKSGASQMVSKLEKKGFVERRQSAHSNKEYWLYLTQTGWAAYHTHERMHGEERVDLFEHLSEFPVSELDKTAQILGALEKTLDTRLKQADLKKA